MAQIKINVNRCKRCGICIAFCLKHVFSLDVRGEPSVEHPENCIICQLCVMRCPDFAIEVSEGTK